MFPLFNFSALANIIQNIENLLEERFQEDDLIDCFVVDIINNNSRLEIYIDGDEGVDFTKCRKASRHIEEYLDTSLVLGEKYTLDVSSPGVDRPIKLKRQYPKHIGRKIQIILNEERDKKYVGILKEVHDEDLLVDFSTKKEKNIKSIKFDDIYESKILISI